MAEPPPQKKPKSSPILRPPPFHLPELLQSVICILALQTHEPPPKEDDDYEDSPRSVVKGGAPGGALGGLSWPSQVDNRKKLVFTYGDCLLPFLLTCKAALSLVDDVLLPVSITPSGGPLKKRTLLMAAVIRNDLPLVRRMIEVAKGWNIDARATDARTREGGTALTFAASLWHGEAVQALLDAGANPAAAMRCVFNLRSGLLEHPDLVTKIILSDAPQDFFYSYKSRKMENGTYERIPVKWSEQRIYQALEYEIPELVRTQYGVVHSEDSIDDLSETLFDEMYEEGHDLQRRREAMRAFAEHPNLTFRHRTVLAGLYQDVAWLRELSVAASFQELVQFVLPAAAASGAIDLVRRALESGGDVNQFWWGQGVPSIVAAAAPRFARPHLGMVELLADNDEIDIDDGLLAASYCGLTSLVKRFLDFGADPDLEHEYDATPLYVSIDEGHVEATRSLLDAGATKVTYGHSPPVPPLFFACEQSDVKIEIVLLLLDRGADVNTFSSSHSWGPLLTPLMAVSGSDERDETDEGLRRDVVQLLLDRGANPKAVDKDGHTALYFAEKSGNTLVADVLRKHSAGMDVVHKS